MSDQLLRLDISLKLNFTWKFEKMDGFNEKKWFVYLGDHHEGPFSLAELQSKLSEGQVTTTSYVWSEGMPDWKIMKEVDAFDSVLSAGVASTSSVSLPLIEDVPAMPQINGVLGEPQAAAALAPVQENQKIEVENLPANNRPNDYYSGPSGFGRASTQQVKYEFEEIKTPSRVPKKLITLLLFAGGAGAYSQGYLDPVVKSPIFQAAGGAISDLAHPYLMKAAHKAPFLEKWISPIPRIEDVSQEEYQELRAAAAASLESEGAKIAVALERTDLTNPIFYIAGNLPDETQIDVYVEGVPDSLLNQMNFVAKAETKFSKKISKTQPVKSLEGKPLPRGQYNVYLVVPESQVPAVKPVLDAIPAKIAQGSASVPVGAKVLGLKKYFLGGKNDATYAERLKEFHDKLRARAISEINDVKQYALTLDSQLNESIAKFFPLKKGKLSTMQRRHWNDFHNHWEQFSKQMNGAFEKWTPSALQNEYFYGMLYQMVQQTAQEVEKVHALHQSFMMGKTDQKSFEVQLGEVESSAKASVATLKGKIDQAEKIPPTPNGMPRKEGL